MAAGFTNLIYKPLKEKERIDLYLAFCDAFEDYPIPFYLTLEAFINKFINRLGMDFPHSAGIWDGDRLVGFVIVRLYENSMYYAAVGVRREYQGKGLLRSLLSFQESLVSGLPISTICLEVLKENARAIHVYRDEGFIPTRTLLSYEGMIRTFTPDPNHREWIKVESVPWEEVSHWMTDRPSFMNSPAVVHAGSKYEQAYVWHDKGGLAALLVINPDNGRVSTLLVRPDLRRQGLGRQMLQLAARKVRGRLVFINVPAEDQATRGLLQAFGFPVICDQIEMKKEL